MRKVLLFCLLSLFLGSACSKWDNRDLLCPKLKEVVETYIAGDSHAPIISLTFSSINGNQLLLIRDDNYFDKRFVDFYFTYQNKVVTIYSTDKKDRSDLYNKQHMNLFTDSIPNCKSYEPEGGNLLSSTYTTRTKTYRIISRDSFGLYNNESLHQSPAKDRTVIRNEKLNNVINRYINKHPAVLYLIKFKRIADDLYIVFTDNFFYEDKDLDGCFYRNGHLIAVYNLKDATNKLIEKKEIKKNPRIFHEYRQAPLSEYWLNSHLVCLRVDASGKVDTVRDFQKIYEISKGN